MGVKLKLLHHEELSCCRPLAAVAVAEPGYRYGGYGYGRGYGYGGYGYGGYRGYYGKRSADADAVAEADAEPGYYGYGGYGLGYGYGGYGLGYRGYGYRGYYGKRSADAEADAEPGYY